VTDLTPHQLGFIWGLEHELSQVEYRTLATKALAAQTKGEAAAKWQGQIRAQEWLAKTIKQALAREAPRGDG